MIQRIQSVYLFVVFLLTTLMFFFPLAGLIVEGEGIYHFIYKGVPAHEQGQEMILNAWPVAILLGIIALNSLVTIFLFKKRILQIRFTIFNIVLMLGAIGLIYFNISNQAEIMGASVQYQIPLVFLPISAILSYLAIRAIGKDEALVRAMDRIR